MLTNENNVPLPMAVLLAHDEYDHVKTHNYISVTGLLKPLKAIILGTRVPASDIDIMDLVPSTVGTAVHNELERSWLDGNHAKAMYKLGYGREYIDSIEVNPTRPTPGKVQMYLENRVTKDIHGFEVGGKYDFIWDGTVCDLKNTKAFTYKKGDDTDYILQLSIYRWLNQDKITSDIGLIFMSITDWKAYECHDPKYPQTPVVTKEVKLMSIEATEDWLVNKLNSFKNLVGSPEIQIPRCTKAELWRDDTKFKFFSKPDSKRATKVFDNIGDANSMLMAKGNKGYVQTVEGAVRRCKYCIGPEHCNQAAEYLSAGLL